MMIEVVTSGGFGGLAAAGMKKATTMEDLPDAEYQAYCDAFAPHSLAALAAVQPEPGRADTVTYEITVTDDAGPHRFKLDETQLPPELLDMIDALPKQ